MEELTSGDAAAASLAQEPRGQADGEGRSPREAEAFEDAVEEASTASASPVACCGGEAAAEASSPSAWRSQGAGPLAADEAETYESPSSSSSGCAAMEGEESPSVSELREEPGRVDTGIAASPSGQRAGGAEEHENSMATPGAGSPSREETESCTHARTPSSPVESRPHPRPRRLPYKRRHRALCAPKTPTSHATNRNRTPSSASSRAQPAASVRDEVFNLFD